MIKLQTGISTDMDFIKAMKEKGQDVKAEFPAETLRKQLDEVNENVKVTFESTNETVLAAVNKSEEPVPVKQINFKSAVKLNVAGDTESDNQSIVENGDKYEVAKDGNTILVTDKGLIPYIGGNIAEPKKWVGVLVDLGVKVTGKEYTIEDVDYSDASRWGALNDTTFIMWLTTENGGEYTFTNLEDSKDKITVTVNFTE